MSLEENDLQARDEPLFEELDSAEMVRYDSICWAEPFPKEGFQAGTITFSAGTNSSLQWAKEITLLEQIKANQLQCLTFLDLGLFNNVKQPLTNKTQFLSNSLAIKHFIDSAYIPFQEQIFGCVLFAGDILKIHESLVLTLQEGYQDWLQTCYPEHSPEIQKNFFSYYVVDAFFEYLHLLSNMLPRKLLPLVLINATELSPTLFCKILLLGQKNNLQLGFRNALFPTGNPIFVEGIDTGYFIGDIPSHRTIVEEPVYALCFDEKEAPLIQESIDKVVADLIENHVSFKVISEDAITAEWMGIEKLIFVSSSIKPMTKRKLQGFAAAQGEIYIVGNSSSFAEGTPWKGLSDLS